jgi:hypothetical protein
MTNILVTLSQTETMSPGSSGFGALVVTGGLIGIYAARRSQRKASFRQLSAGHLMLGAAFGVLLLTLMLLVALIKAEQVSVGESFARWVGWGIGGALFIGGPAALIARFSKKQ